MNNFQRKSKTAMRAAVIRTAHSIPANNRSPFGEAFLPASIFLLLRVRAGPILL